MDTAISLPLDTMQAGADELCRLAFLHEKDTLEQSLHAFVKASWVLVEPSHAFIDNWHIVELCRVLEDVYYGRTKRLLINIPPGTMKSLIVDVFFPCWVWAKNARKRFLCASYGQHLTTRDNVRARQIIESDWFQSRWPVHLVDDQNTKTRYNTNLHGWRIATSVNGVGTGEHPDFIIIDDPTSAEQAESDTSRKAANDWFDNTISQRLGRKPAIIIVMQRLHKDDLCAHVKKRGGWTTIVWPMRYEQCTCSTSPEADVDEEKRCKYHKDDPTWRPDPRDPRTKDGELLCPAAYPESEVKDRELNLGPNGTPGQMQQRPGAAGGHLFKRGWFKFLDARPKKIVRSVRAYDTAATDGDGDYSVGVRIDEMEDGTWLISSVWREQVGPSDLDKAMRANAELDGKEVAVREEKEGGSAGKAVVEARAKMLKGFDYKFVQITGAKPLRVKPFRSQVEAGNVFLLRAGWNEEYISELCDFPTGKHDDQVDASGAAFNAILLEPKRNTMGAVW